MADTDRNLADEQGRTRAEVALDWQAAWETEDNYWQENFSSRPYALGADYYDKFRPAYRYGFESARDGLGRTWDDAEADLRSGWDRREYDSSATISTWDEIRAAVRDAWDRVTGRVADEAGAVPRMRE